MTDDADENRLMGGVLARLDNIKGRQETIHVENRNDHALIFEKLNAIALAASAESQRIIQHEADIVKLKERPERLVAIGSGCQYWLPLGCVFSPK